MFLFKATASLLLIMGPVTSSSETLSNETNNNNSSNTGWEASFYYILHPPPPYEQQQQQQDADDSESNAGIIDREPFFHDLHTALRHYREMADGLVRQLSMAHEVASRTEALLFPHHRGDGNTEAAKSPSFLSHKLEQKITKSARLLEQNIFVLEGLLKPFPVTVGLSPLHNAPHIDSTSNLADHTHPTTSSPSSNSHFTFPPPNENSNQHKQSNTESSVTLPSLARYISPHKPSQSNTNELVEGEKDSYDTASHTITHISRDWTANGASIRKDTHDWIVDQLWIYHKIQVEENASLPLDSTCSQKSSLSPVLVPGAGMARLAFDIAFAQNENMDYDDRTKVPCYPFVVEANDNSIVMATAAYHLLRHCSSNDKDVEDGSRHTGSLTIYPLVSDPFTNEEDTERRWEAATFPEDTVSNQLCRLRKQQSSSHKPSLSYVIGDFTSTYASPSRHGVYGSIATCFFIDTATNIYEYILTIRNLLRAGGVWVNLGPVQWHRNAMLQPSANELKDIILLAGFDIKHWGISETLLAYRHPDDIREGTRAEAYRPLKFVAVLQPDETRADDAARRRDDLPLSLEKLRYLTGRKPEANTGFGNNFSASNIVDD